VITALSSNLLINAALVAYSGRVLGTEFHHRLLNPKGWAASAAGMPNCQNDQLVVERRVVDVVTTTRQEYPARACDGGPSIGMSDVGCRGDQRKSSVQLVEE
jgi:hypothetical protein